MFPLPTRKRGSSIMRAAFPLAIAAVIGLCAVKPAHALAPAGSTINNQAIGVYTDGSGVNQNVTSNSVQTVVQPIAGFSLAAPNNKNATIGSTVSFSHTITNTGNSTDVFDLTAVDQNAGDNFNIIPIVHADANGDGIADGLLPITKTPSLAPGESYQFVVTGVVAGVTGNAKITVTGVSEFDSAETHANIDTVNISTNAQINVVKSIDKSTGAPGSGPYTYTLTYTNSGSTAATNLTITDVLPLGLVYVPGSGVWSGSATPLTDPALGDPTGIQFAGNVVPQTVVANVLTVPAGSSGRVSFQVTVANTVLPGIIPNIALYAYNDGVTLLGTSPTNTVNLTITQLTSLTYTGQTITTDAAQGAVVTFTNPLVNTSTGGDTFNITLLPGATPFPLGTTFQLYKSDGVNLLQDTNGDGIPDTGIVGAGITYNVVVKATLPTLAVGAGPYIVNSIAASTISPLTFATAVDRLNGIKASTVDLTNDAAGTLGGGAGPTPGPGVLPITILNGVGGTLQNFTLFIKNTGAVADAYILTASTDGNFGIPLTLPAGVTLTFKNDAGGIVTGTGSVAAGDIVKVNANVFLPVGILPQDIKIYFRALSPLTGAVDTKLDQVTVTGLRSVAISPNGVGQVYPGNATVYTHVFTNTGTLPEGGGDGVLTSKVTMTSANTAGGFTSVIYRDANNDGVLDATDPIVTDLPTVGAGQSITLFVKVYAAAGTDLGTVNATTLTATTTGGLLVPAAVTLKDSTTVIAGQVRMQKLQALSTGGALVYTVNRITTGAKPGAIIRYQIVATNVGTANATGFVITDATPPFTIYDQGDASSSGTGVAGWSDGTTFHLTDSPLNNGDTGKLTFTIGTLAPGQSATVTFGVKIQ